MASDSHAHVLNSAPATGLSAESSAELSGQAVFEEEVVGFFVDAAEILGVPPSVAAIYGVVFASPVPLSFSEIELRVSFSKGSVSQGLRVLREVGAIKAAGDLSSNSDLPSPKSSKTRERYEPDMELRKLIRHFLESRLQSQLDNGSGRLDRIKSAIPRVNGEESQVLRNRTKYLASWHKKARALLPIIRATLMLVPKR